MGFFFPGGAVDWKRLGQRLGVKPIPNGQNPPTDMRRGKKGGTQWGERWLVFYECACSFVFFLF